MTMTNSGLDSVTSLSKVMYTLPQFVLLSFFEPCKSAKVTHGGRNTITVTLYTMCLNMDATRLSMLFSELGMKLGRHLGDNGPSFLVTRCS